MTVDARKSDVLVKPAPLVGADELRTTDAGASSSNLANRMNNTITTTGVQKNRLPGWIGFPLAVVISFGLSAGLYSFVPDVAGYELATVSRSLNEPWQIAALLLWKLVELSIAWSSGLDCKELINKPCNTSPY